MRIILSTMLILLLVTATYHIKSTQQNEITKSEIIGKWYIKNVYLAGNHIAKETVPDRNRWIVFSADGLFKSGGKDFGLSKGQWIFNEKHSTLYMVTENHEKSIWEIKMEGNRLIWNGIGDTGQKDFKFVLQKKGWMNPLTLHSD